MNYVSKLFTGTVLLSLSACVVNNTSSTGAGGGDGGSGSTSTSQGGGATTTSVGGGNGVGGMGVGGSGVGGMGVGGSGVGGSGNGVGGMGVGGEGGGMGGMGGGGAGGGMGGMGGGGAGGGSGCTQITLADLAPAQVAAAGAAYLGEVAPNLGGVDPDTLSAEFYGPAAGSFDGGLTGSFDLTMNGDDNYSTCSRCLLVEDDEGKLYFQSEGTLVIDAGSQQLTGSLNATVTGLRLVEVTVAAMTFVSTPVPNGACLEIAAADFDAVWNCPGSYLNDGFCDCGCGATDVDCAGDMTAAACDYCNTAADGGCAASDTCPSDIDPANNAVCL